MGDLIKELRLHFLHAILNEDRNSLVHRFFQAQLNHPTKKDWVTSARNDLKSLEINLSFDEIKQKKQGNYNMFVHKKIYQNVFNRLNEDKQKYSKVREIEYNTFVMQTYFQANCAAISKEEAKLIFKLRCRIVDVKCNMKWKYEDTVCDACGEEEETQEHVFECENLREEGRSWKKIDYEPMKYGSLEDKSEAAKLIN